MLALFRKYQKALFIVIAVVITLSFSFFGTYSVLTGLPQKKEDSVVAKGLDGTLIKETEVKQLAYFLSSHPFSEPFNLINHDFLEPYFFDTGIATLLFKRNQDFYEKEWELRKGKIQNFKPYQHYSNPGISALLFWYMYAPNIGHLLQDLQKEFSVENYIKLYLAEKKFPAPYLRRALLMQTKTSPNTPVDPSLAQRDLSLFGFQNAKDWFSATFLEEIALLILQGNKLAEKEGTYVSKEQAKQEVFSLLRKIAPKEDTQSLYAKQIRALGFKESVFLSLCQKIFGFKAWMDKAADAVLLEQETFAPIKETSLSQIQIKLFELAPNIRSSSILEQAKVMLYFQNTLKDPNNLYEPDYLSCEQIKEKAPELVYQAYKIRWAKSDLEQASLDVPILVMVNWEKQPANWQKLREAFPLIIPALSSKEDPLWVLENLPRNQRKQVEAFARKQIVLENPNWAYDFLAKKEKKESPLLVDGKGKVYFSPVQNQEKLSQFLQELFPTKEAFFEDQKEEVFSLQLVEKKEKLSLFTLEDCRNKNLLDKRVTQELETYYTKLQEMHPSLFLEEGKKKPLSEVKEEVARLLFENNPKRASFHSFIASYYEQKAAGKAPETPPFILEERELWIQKEHPLFNEASHLCEKELSKLHSEKENQIFFFEVKKKNYQNDFQPEVHACLKQELNRNRLLDLLERCSKK